MRTYRWTWETDTSQCFCTHGSHLPPSASTSPLASISRVPVTRACVSVARMLAMQELWLAAILAHSCRSFSWDCSPPAVTVLLALAVAFFLLMTSPSSLLGLSARLRCVGRGCPVSP